MKLGKRWAGMKVQIRKKESGLNVKKDVSCLTSAEGLGQDMRLYQEVNTKKNASLV